MAGSDIKKVSNEISQFIESGDACEAHKRLEEIILENSSKDYKSELEKLGINTERAFGAKKPVLKTISYSIQKSISSHYAVGQDLIHFLWRSKIFEERIIAGFLMHIPVISAKKAKVDYELLMLKGYISESENWAVCDAISENALCNLIQAMPAKMFRVLSEYAKDENLWVRRSAAIAISAYGQDNKKIEIKKALSILGSLVDENETYVRKGVIIALKNMSKNYKKQVFEFALKYAKNADENTKEVLKDGIRKLPKKYQALVIKKINAK